MWVYGFMSTITAVKNNNNTRRYFGEGGPVGAPSNSQWGHFNRGLGAFPLVLGTPSVLPPLTLQQTHPNRSQLSGSWDEMLTPTDFSSQILLIAER